MIMPSKMNNKVSKSNGTSKAASAQKVYHSSKNGHVAKAVSSNKTPEMSDSDKLTLRAWKQTYANNRKNAD